MSQYELLLAERIVQDHFGTLSRTIVLELFKRNQLTLHQLHSNSKIGMKQLKECLFILVQHGIVNWSERIDAGTADKISTLYSVSMPNIFVRPIFPCIVDYVIQRLENSVGAIEILKHGFLNGNIAYEWISTSTERLEGLKLMLQEGLLVILSNLGNLEGNPGSVEKKRKMSKSEPIPQTKKSLIDESIVPDSFYCINYKRIIDLFRYQRIVSYFRTKYNQSTADVVNCILKIHLQNDYSGNATTFAINQSVQGKIFLSEFDQKHHSLASVGVDKGSLLNEYLELICNDSCKIFTRKDGIILLNERAISHQIEMTAFQSLIKEHFGKSAMRIFNLLVGCKNALDDKLISKHALLPMKEIRELLFSMVKYGAIRSQEVPRTSDHMPSKTWFLWAYSHGETLKSVQGHLLHSLYNVCQIVQMQYSTNALLLAKTQRLDVQANPALLSDSERESLKNVYAILNQLEYLYISMTQESFVLGKWKFS